MLARRFHVRWWHWLLLMAGFLLLLLAALAIGMRLHGEQRYTTVIETIRVAGKPVTIADLVISPPADADVQERWDRWVAAPSTYPDSKFSHPDWNRFITGHEPLTDAIRQQIEARRSDMQTGRELLRNDALRIGFLRLLHPAPPRTMQEYGTLSPRMVQDWLAARCLAIWLTHEAAVASDPRSALTDLDALMHRADQPLSLLDAMLLHGVGESRDRAYRTVALQGRLPPDLRLAWLAEAPLVYEWLASGFETDRVIFTDLMATTFESMSWTTAAFSADPTGMTGEAWTPMQVVNGTYGWSTMLHDCALIAEVQAHLSARLRRERLDPVSATLDQRMQGVIARISLPHQVMSAAVAIKFTTQHRVDRLVVRLLVDAPRLGLPRDEAELLTRHGAQVLAPIDDLLGLRYEYLASDRFRLAIDPATPVPDFADAGIIHGWTTMFGKPPAAEPIKEVNGSLEIQVPAVLFRP